MSARLGGRRALVTGAGRGFGRAIALGLAREGADVAVHYNRSRAGAEEVAAEIRALGREAGVHQADLTSWSEIARLADEVGPLDVLVNSVGDVAPEQHGWREITEPLIDRVLAVYVKGTMLMCHEVGRKMLDRVNAIGPGYIETASTLEREDWRSGRREWVLERTPLGRIPPPEELVGTVAFLASEDAGHMTGGFLICDLGFSMVGA